MLFVKPIVNMVETVIASNYVIQKTPDRTIANLALVNSSGTGKSRIIRAFSGIPGYRIIDNTSCARARRIVPTITTPAKKGDITVENIYESFREHFMDDSFQDVSRIGKYADILATTDTNEKVLVELKDYTNEVPSSEVDKFWRDMEVRNSNYGIFISMRTGISKCSSCINLKRKLNRTAIFIVNNELNWKGHLFAFYIIKKLVEIEKLQHKETVEEDLSSAFSRVYNIIRDIQRLTEDIDEISKTADEIKTLSGKRLDKIVSIVNIYKLKINEKIELSLKEFEGVEM